MPIGKLTVAKTKTKTPGRYGDGGGLWLAVGPNSKSWVFRYMIDGRSREMGIGSFDDIGLADAREKARQLRALVHRKPEDGGPLDPLDERQAAEVRAKVSQAKVMTFRQCAEAYIKAHESSWKSAIHARQWPQSLADYVYPTIGDLPVDAIDTALVVKVLEPAWLKRTATLSRVRGRIESVLGWATVRGFRQGDNPARWKGHLDTLLPSMTKVKTVEHHAALPYAEIGAFVSQLRSRESISAAALEFTILTAARSEEVMGAKWSEIDLANRLWTVPASRMKAGVEHVVPLSDPAVVILEKLAIIRHNDFVFPGRRGRLNKIALFAALRRFGRDDITAHGFRSSFRDWCGDCTAYPRDVAEACLAHRTGDATEQAYRRSSAIEKRRQLMDAWARYIDAPPVSEFAEIVPLRVA